MACADGAAARGHAPAAATAAAGSRHGAAQAESSCRCCHGCAARCNCRAVCWCCSCRSSSHQQQQQCCGAVEQAGVVPAGVLVCLVHAWLLAGPAHGCAEQTHLWAVRPRPGMLGCSQWHDTLCSCFSTRPVLSIPWLLHATGTVPRQVAGTPAAAGSLACSSLWLTHRQRRQQQQQ